MTKEEAIKIIESNCSCSDSKLREACAMFIPELAESEDEKIREWCISHFKECFRASKDNLEYRQYLNNKIIPWLEKQKDKITAEELENLESLHLKLKKAKENKYIRVQFLKELMRNGIITEADYLYLKDDKRKPWTEEEYRIAYQNGFEMSEQLKQMSAEWSEDDTKEHIDAICQALVDNEDRIGFYTVDALCSWLRKKFNYNYDE